MMMFRVWLQFIKKLLLCFLFFFFYVVFWWILITRELDSIGAQRRVNTISGRLADNRVGGVVAGLGLLAFFVFWRRM